MGHWYFCDSDYEDWCVNNLTFILRTRGVLKAGWTAADNDDHHRAARWARVLSSHPHYLPRELEIELLSIPWMPRRSRAHQSFGGPMPPMRRNNLNGIEVNHKLPSTVESVRMGWQLTCQGSAVVSGLLAGVAAQLLSFFRDNNSYEKRPTGQGAKDTVLALCYAALLLNIGATISAFMVIDKMGSLTISAARRPDLLIGRFNGTEVGLLEKYGAGKKWKYMVWHWLLCFYGGVLCLAILLLTFIWLQEPLSVGIVMSVLCGFTLVPSMIFFAVDSDTS
ncbi:hypothetical protein BDZ97DRAFT_1027659 [Flammula alnicola]|nr:hypothetical protein BDZ97DRAFT_1027659 [Flammula alnicola]